MMSALISLSLTTGVMFLLLRLPAAEAIVAGIIATGPAFVIGFILTAFSHEPRPKSCGPRSVG
jgi:putative flippase GtrA